jgi:hypothetical protein
MNALKQKITVCYRTLKWVHLFCCKCVPGPQFSDMSREGSNIFIFLLFSVFDCYKAVHRAPIQPSIHSFFCVDKGIIIFQLKARLVHNYYKMSCCFDTHGFLFHANLISFGKLTLYIFNKLMYYNS